MRKLEFVSQKHDDGNMYREPDTTVVVREVATGREFSVSARMKSILGLNDIEYAKQAGITAAILQVANV